MKILVLTQAYPSADNPYPMAFVHARNKVYQAHGHTADVLNFSEKIDYEYDGIKVLKERSVRVVDYDFFVFHAPNLRNHLRFLIRNKRWVKKLCFILHGYESLRVEKYLPRFYDFNRPNLFKHFLINLYDSIKVLVLGFTIKALKKSSFGVIFVSQTFKNKAFRELRLDESVNSRVIHNPSGPSFNQKLESSHKREAGFFTIRPFDSYSYSIDLLVELARLNPHDNFHLYGEGEFFKHRERPKNLFLHSGFLNHQQILELARKHFGAVMLTRFDTQGVMSCELASLGIPLLVSDIDTMREVLADFSNVSFIANDNLSKFDFRHLKRAADELPKSKFMPENTAKLELSFFEELSQ